jgi:hypothetical protein
MMRGAKAIACAAMLGALLLAGTDAQEGFGFGDVGGDASQAAASAPGAGVRFGGSLEIGGTLYSDEIDNLGAASLGDLYLGRLSFDASGSDVDASVRLKASQDIIKRRPQDIVDEAWLRVSAGPLNLEGGLMKLTWGKADSRGPLDILNPLDLRDLTVTDSMERKVARPMLHASLAAGQSSKVEAVFLPGFEGMTIAASGRWRPVQFDELEGKLAYIDTLRAGYSLSPAFAGVTYASLFDVIDMSGLADSQAGARFTTSLGSIDLGLQYYYGYLFAPAVKFSGSPLPSSVELVYNRFHQIGADFAAVLAGFNARAELAADLTEDLGGDDPSVYNPNLAFSLGVDHALPAGLSLNLQYAGTYRLKDGEVDRSAASYDIEKGTDSFSSNLNAVLSQSLFKDALKLEATVLWEIGDKDILVLPSATYAVGDAELELAAGIFGGDGNGPLGQYADSSYVKASIGYKF